MHEVWSSPSRQRCARLIICVAGLYFMSAFRAWPPDNSWLSLAVGVALLYYAWPSPMERRLLEEPLLLAALRADGIESQWPVARRIPYGLVCRVEARSPRHRTFVDIVLDDAAPAARDHRRLRLHFDSDAAAAPFIVALERRVGTLADVDGMWFRRTVDKERERPAVDTRRRIAHDEAFHLPAPR